MTTAVDVVWSFRVITDAPAELLREHSRQVMDELLKLEACSPLTDSAVSLNLDGPEITIEVAAEGEDYQSAINEALSGIRTAIHAAGGQTPGWEDAFSLEPTELQARGCPEVRGTSVAAGC